MQLSLSICSQVCEDVCQRMRTILNSQRKTRHVSEQVQRCRTCSMTIDDPRTSQEEDVHCQAIQAKFQSVRLLLRDRHAAARRERF